MEPTLRQRRSRAAATGAFLFLATAFWLDWWLIRAKTSITIEWGYDLFRGGEGAEPWAVWFTSLLLLAITLWVFIRVAGNSLEHEVEAWRRDLLLQTGAGAVALASLWLWPQQHPVWQTQRMALNDTAGGEQVLQTLPGLGWWCVLLAVLLLGLASWMARDTSDK